MNRQARPLSLVSSHEGLTGAGVYPVCGSRAGHVGQIGGKAETGMHVRKAPSRHTSSTRNPCVQQKCCFGHYTSTQLGHEMAYLRRDSHQGLLQRRGSPKINVFSSCIDLEGGPANAIMRRWQGGRPCEGGDRIRLAASLPPPLGFCHRPRRAAARCCGGGREVPSSFRLDAPSSPSSHASPTVGPASFPHASPLRAKLAPQLPPP